MSLEDPFRRTNRLEATTDESGSDSGASDSASDGYVHKSGTTTTTTTSSSILSRDTLSKLDEQPPPRVESPTPQLTPTPTPRATPATNANPHVEHSSDVNNNNSNDNNHGGTTSSRSSSGSGLKDELCWLHADELVSLAQRRKPIVMNPSDPYPVLARKILLTYLRYLWATWTRCLWSLIVLPSTLLDRLIMIAFAFFSSLILFAIMIWCLIINMPSLVNAFEKWSHAHAGGLSMTNASYPSIFRNTRADEPTILAARRVLSSPFPARHRYSPNGAATYHPEHGHYHYRQEEGEEKEDESTERPRVFNLDVAKLLFQCAALMYERTSSPLLDALETTRNRIIESEGTSGVLAGNATVSSTSTSFPDPTAITSTTTAIGGGIKAGEVLKDTLGASTARLVAAHLHERNAEENEMTRFAHKLGMRYATLSELNSQTSAGAGMFWDPNSNFIILAFKGTELGEFGEWAADFAYEPREAGDWIRGFGRVHGGFMEKVFPRRVPSGSRVPYYTIRDAVRRTAASLLSRNPPGTKVNVWFTGHSLGTAMGSLVYARAIHEPKEFGPGVVIRDAYMYAAPILCDVQSARAFHNRLYYRDDRRTLWRITNGSDCVATLLPDWGDVEDEGMKMRIRLSPYNLFSFAHLGVELRMCQEVEKGGERAKCKVVVSGSAMPHGSLVHVEGVETRSSSGTSDGDGFGKGAKDVAIKEEIAEAMRRIAMLMRVPILGRIVAHGTAPYWDQLQRVQAGRLEWE